MLMIAFLHFLYLVQNACIYIGQEIMAVNKVFQLTGLTKLRLPK